MLRPEMNGLVTKMAQSMGFCPNLPKICKKWFFDENEQLFFHKFFTDIGSSGFMEFGSASKRTNASK